DMDIPPAARTTAYPEPAPSRFDFSIAAPHNRTVCVTSDGGERAMETRQDDNPFSSLLESWAQWFGRAPLPGAPGEGSARLAALQQETLARHAQLWQSQLLRKPGEAVAPVIQPAPG